ncbi:MAG: hypothetical protein M1833_004747 [Piccolia ochrophora]|nr:MAG: hypothetical protein M1833_004747 [Piccolia ochrophora]
MLFNELLFLALSLTTAFAAPKRRRTEGGSFIVHPVTHKKHTKNPTNELRKAARKYGWSLDLPSHGGEDGSKPAPLGVSRYDTEPATPNTYRPPGPSRGQTDGARPLAQKGEAEGDFTPEETQFLVPVTIGTQTLNVNLDTGSADFWVYNSRLPSDVQEGHIVYNPDIEGTTFKQIEGASFAITYGDASMASGIVGTEKVNIGGAVVEDQAVQLATAVTGFFVDEKDTDGILGLAFTASNQVVPEPQKSFFDNIQASLESPVFTVALRDDINGSYEFGYTDPDKFDGDLTYVKVLDAGGFWEVRDEGFTVNGKDIPSAMSTMIFGTSRQVTVFQLQKVDFTTNLREDTGTTLIVMHDEVAEAYYKEIEGAGYSTGVNAYTVPCNTAMPEFGIKFGSKVAAVPGHQMLYSKENETHCVGGLQPNGNEHPQILGGIFFQAQFAEFRWDTKEIGVAPHQNLQKVQQPWETMKH